jgi:uncharacterized membrane protein YciS (DUF1049 family)
MGSVIFLEAQARLLLVAHLIIGVALVASATHQVVWMRGYRRGQFGRHRGARRFAVITALLYVTGFALGNLIYPAYKVRVRVEYLDSPTALVKEREVRRSSQQLASRAAARGGDAPVAHPDQTPADPRRAAKIARWFDVKEHWAALGLALALANAALMLGWDPRRDGAAPAGTAFGLGLGTAAAAWFAAVVGVIVTSFRAVGPAL